jgi:hypothetical protein
MAANMGARLPSVSQEPSDQFPPAFDRCRWHLYQMSIIVGDIGSRWSCVKESSGEAAINSLFIPNQISQQAGLHQP